MFKPINHAEMLMFSTVKISTKTGEGTGFFFDFELNGGIIITVLITNNHVINYNMHEKVQLIIHENGEDLLKENHTIIINAEWIMHPKYDLCFTFVNLIDDEFKKIGKQYYRNSLKEFMIKSDDELNHLSMLEDVIMVGYPIGLSDKKNNLPIFRKGTTATHPGINFNAEREGVVDISCYPGNSGSPIFIYNEGGYISKFGKNVIGECRFIFLGINHSVHVYTEEGKIVEKEIPTSTLSTVSLKQFINTSIYIKASVILSFKSLIQSMIDNSLIVFDD